MDASIGAGDAGRTLGHVNLPRIDFGRLAVKEEGWCAGTAGDDAVEPGRGKGGVIFLLVLIDLEPLGSAEEQSAKRVGRIAEHGLKQQKQQEKCSCRIRSHIDTNLA